jgi:hypothetical protein
MSNPLLFLGTCHAMPLRKLNDPGVLIELVEKTFVLPILVIAMIKINILGLTLIAIIIVTTTGHAQPAESGTQAPHFTASPTSGQAPLTVTFCASAGIGVDFGDGTSSRGIAPSGACPMGDVSFTHIYTAAGTYQLRGFPCPSSHDTICGEVARQANTVTITVVPAP